MNSVDLADQLQNCYRFNHWLRNRKWWWAIFLWAMGVAASNAYIMYERMYEEEKKKQKEMLNKCLQMEFLEEIINDFVGWASPTEVATGNTSVSGSAATCHGLSYSSVASQPEHYFDLTTEDGKEEFLNLVMHVSLTKK